MSTLAVVVTWTDDPERHELARRMIDELSGWAPEGTHVVEAPGAALAFGRLVVSRSQGHQLEPLVRPDEGLYIVSDSRVDNRVELTRELGLPPGSTGAEVVLACYQRWGEDAASHVDGDFAFVVWDSRRRRVYAARDPAGVRPLVYRAGAGRLLIASDVEQILAVDPTARRVDDHAAVDHLLYRWRFPDRTYFEPIKAVPSAHYVVAEPNALTVRRHFSVPSGLAPFADDTEAVREFRRVFFEAVRERLESDHPAVLHLSGGFDSTAIACAADVLRKEGAQVPSMSAVGVAYPGLSCDESEVLETFEDHFTFPVEICDGTAPNLQDVLAPALAGPGMVVSMNSGTTCDLDLVSREGARVLLAGFAGEILSAPSGILRDLLAQGDVVGWARAAGRPPFKTLAQRARHASTVLRESVPERVRSVLRPFRHLSRAPTWMTPAARRWAAEPGPVGPLITHRPRECTAILGAVGASFMGPNTSRALTHAQRPVSGRRAELRAPFLDVAVLRCALRLPLRSWGSRRYADRFHRRALEDILPASVRGLTRKTAFDSVFIHRLKRLPQNVQGPGESPLARFVDLGRLAEARRSFSFETSPGPGALSPTGLWSAAVLEAWLRRVLA